jgi:hypothetical protein
MKYLPISTNVNNVGEVHFAYALSLGTVAPKKKKIKKQRKKV